MKKIFDNLTLRGKVMMTVFVIGCIIGLKFGYDYLFPKKAKASTVTTKATGLPPLAYDKAANAPYRKVPELNEHVDVQSAEIRGAIMAWNGFSAASYAVGGNATSKGSLAEELGLNIRLSVQNSCTEQSNQLYAFAEELHSGNPNPTKGVHMVNWMGDGVPNYITGLNARLRKDFGDEYRAVVVYFSGASFGEDKWMLKQKYAKNAVGSVTATVPRDGDWNIIMIKSQTMGWPVNHDLGTYDPTKVNIVAAPNDDYVEAGKMYTSGAKVTLKLVRNGKITNEDTTVVVNGVASWFPVDQQVTQLKGGLVTVASTEEYGSQMACAIVMIKKWADDNRPLVEKMIEAFGKAGEQIKSHDDALKFATQVNEIVFADKEKDADAWYNAYKSFTMTDDDGNEVKIGGSRAFSLADAAYYTGVAGGTDKYKYIYNTFGSICKEAYPEVLSDYEPYDQATDWSFLRAVYNKNKSAGTAGSVSKIDFSTAQKGNVIGDASYSIEFNTGSAEIKASSYPVLEKIVGQLNVASNAFVEISGHTDDVGDDQLNLTLSERRARSVYNYIIQQDPELEEKLKSRGYGETKPIADNSTSEGKARNRRVEIKLFKAKL